MSKGIYDRGYLPHWDFGKSVQAITFRLADSIPASVIQDWRNELAAIREEAARERELHRRIARYEDAGHGSATLSRQDCAAVLQDQLIADHPEKYRLLDWCVMPNHVHVICKLHETSSLRGIVRSWKGASAIQINRILDRSGPLWQREYYDRLIRDTDHYYDCRAYIRNNPVKAKLCDTPESWPFSSAGNGWTERWL